MTDGELVAHIQATGDPAAFGELVRRHEARIRALLRRLTAHDAARADDLAQDTFFAAFRHIATFRGEAAVATWLVRIAVRQYLSDARRKRPEPVAEVGDVVEPERDDPVALVDLDRGLSAIRDEQRLVVVLTFAHGLTHAEVAELTGWPLGTVKTHALRGRAALRDALTGDDDE